VPETRTFFSGSASTIVSTNRRAAGAAILRGRAEVQIRCIVTLSYERSSRISLGSRHDFGRGSVIVSILTSLGTGDRCAQGGVKFESSDIEDVFRTSIKCRKVAGAGSGG
jgi:hypothetical protein